MKKGFSLPLWIAASVKSAVKNLLGFPFKDFESIKHPNSKEIFSVKVHAAAYIKNNSKSLAITFADSGLDLDLTRNLEIWSIVEFEPISANDINEENLINLIPGEGVGRNVKTNEICISDFAKSIVRENVLNLIPLGYRLNVKVIFPKGRFLAERTSNKAFGIVDGLSIIGTTAAAHESASDEQLINAKKAVDFAMLNKSNQRITFVIGENGLDIARRECITTPVIKIGNWIGPLLVYAAAKSVKEVLIIGYHGKLIKLAGGIFHTHHHLADGRMEILIYLAFKAKLPNSLIDSMSQTNTIEDAFLLVEEFDHDTASILWHQIANTVELRSIEYIKKYLDNKLLIGTVLFDRNRNIRWKGQYGKSMFLKSTTFEE